ncbi:bifunctional lysylphosphatidylglycerol flippase/synthetase MprF [Sphingobium sp. BYY-5]|uniref:bifunctional lysylphosphatidylglycerol flippase/synthetase MprF n=1 Tax=Sphingobium sp. BYY-5 TaxID=2926400 RepID=UPI001FA6DCB0|nr:bifunctional lysylphosphatidylglycerol flippase/synthetase MprF [Sphingobium sp. BYY-5]MCI4589388.1 bifunctional lysylphosphatidylglycerol flippase/synthetase MprF [Sphingobium sp. BYY-5]
MTRSDALSIRAWVGSHRGALSIAAMLAVSALGLIALHALLADVRLRDIRAAFHMIAPRQAALALGLTALSYVALTFYDHVALRVIGRPLPWRTAALASFCSYTLSHNLGLSLLTGGSARYRIYTAAGLEPGDIARIIASASLSFWGGVVVMTGLLMAVHPSLITLGGVALSIPVQRVVGVVILLTAIGVLAAAGRTGRNPKLLGWHIALPSRGQAAAQIGVACIDLAAASAALFVLVPHVDGALYPTFFLGYALAIIVALVSHVPGGLGVFEAVIVATLPDVDRPRLLAALIAYRAIYYLLPLMLGVIAIALHEGASWRRPVRRLLGGAQAAASGMAPVMLAILVAVGGIILLVSGALPAVPARLHTIHGLFPLAFIEASHFAASVVGTLLILLASGLYRRLDAAFWMTRALLLAGILFSLIKGLDYEEASALLLILAVLQWTRGAFYRRTRFTADALSPAWLATLAVAVGLSTWIGFFAYKHVSYQSDLWWDFSPRDDASRFLRAALASGVLVVGAALWRLSRPASPKQVREHADVTASPAALQLANRTDAFLATTGDKLFLTSSTGRAFVMYQVQGHSWIVMGDPVGDRAEWSDLLWTLREMADESQGRLLLYQISLDSLALAIDLGLSIVKYGEEARVDLQRFTLDGPDAKPLRYAERRAAREGASFEIVAAADISPLLPELRAISDRWLAAKGHSEKAFSVGRFDPAYLSQGDCALVRQEGRIVAFANIWATDNRNELSVDLMRHDEAMPYGTMDFLFIRLMQWAREQGYDWFTLGLAPLSGIEARRLSPLWAKAGALLYRHGEGFYGFEGLRAYKDKFSPSWEPRFIGGPQGVSMARAMLDLQKLVSGTPGSAAARTRLRRSPEMAVEPALSGGK